VPIAHRLSLGDLYRRLEDVSFHILDPAGYESLKQEVTPIQAGDDKCLEILIEGVSRLLDKNRIHAAISGRTSLYSIHQKITRTKKPLAEIMDRVGLRVIVATVRECYTVLGLLHTHFKLIPGTFDDYIGMPKENGYQSLHTCIYPVRELSHKPIEFQIRTELMHREAEHGSAAHWLYKGKPSDTGKATTDSSWMHGLVRQHEQAKSTEAFIEMLHRCVYENHLVVFGKGGQITHLHGGATVLDYLNTTNIVDPAGAAVKVNGEIVGIECVLRDGDSIEIVDQKAPPEPVPNIEEILSRNVVSWTHRSEIPVKA
jgi:GTP pyrophosphokinase